MKKKYQIFISSTYTDLIEERKYVQDVILSMNHFPAGMELFSAASEEQWNIIRRTIDTSDFYVLIIGYRYGSEMPDRVGYTEREYLYAKENGMRRPGTGTKKHPGRFPTGRGRGKPICGLSAGCKSWAASA